MNVLRKGECVTGIRALHGDFSRSEPVLVPGRGFHALTFRHCGKISIETEGKRLISEAGCITFMPMGISYTTEILESGSMSIVHFTTTGGEGTLEPFVIRPEHITVMRNLFSALMDRYKVGRECDYACLSMLYEILSMIEYELSRETRAAVPRRMRELRSRIDREFGDSELSVSALAEELGLSEVYLRREFRRHFGLSPIAYIKKVRMDNARLLLRTGYYTVGETAKKCGFESLTYFSGEFHRMTGRTPTEYMREDDGEIEK